MSETKESRLHKFVLDRPKEELDSIRGHPQKVLDLIDEFSYTQESLMNIGAFKGQVIINKIKEVNPKIIIELGGYMGYSAIIFGKELVHDPHAKYYSFEANAEFADIAGQFIELAGLQDKVQIIVGPAAESLVKFETALSQKTDGYALVNFVFLDHWKDLYVPDLRVLESLNLIAPGTVIAADNIYYPGAPDYVKYVQSSPQERREHNYNVDNLSNPKLIGRWNILYDSETIPVIDKKRDTTDAVEIIKCVEYLNG